MNNDWEHFGEEIKQTIQDAIDTKDYSRLNQMVSDTVNHAMDCVSAGIKTVDGTEIRRQDSHYMEIQRMPETGQVQKPEISSGTGKPKISQRNFGKDRRNFSGSDRSCIWIDFCYFPYHHFDWKFDHSV